MNRFHVNLTVRDLAASVSFYTAVFGSAPTVAKPDYAKWMLEDPRVNFSLSTRGETGGVDHVGIEAGSAGEFAALRERLGRAASTIVEQPEVTCCYARSTKAWVEDPDGLAWETFLSHDGTTVYGDGTETRAARKRAVAETPRGAAA